MCLKVFTSIAALAAFWVAPALADETASLKALEARLQQLSAQVDTLNAKVSAQDKIIAEQQKQLQSAPVSASIPAARNLDAAAVAEARLPEPPVKTTFGPGLKIESADGLYSFQPYGRLHFDTTFFRDDKKDRANNQNFRRARLGMRGNIGEDLSYRAEFDFANEDTNFRDVYIAYSGLGFADLTVGNFKPPMGLEQATSSNDISFIERSAVTNALTRGHVLGAGLSSGGDDWSLAGGVFNEDAGTNNGTDDEALSFEARATTDLLRDSDNVLHIGGGASWRKPNSVSNALTLSAPPAGISSTTNLLSTGAINNVDNNIVSGAEAAAAFGPVLLQGEYLRMDIERPSTSPSFDGWYAQAGWLLTGESRPYKGDEGVFGRIKPENPFSLKAGGWGAFELLGRYDTLDLNDANAGINGGELRQYTAAANWYLRDNLRLMLNYAVVDSEDNPVDADDDPHVINLRTQVDF